MALIKCVDCEKQISDSAKQCPNCAAKVPKQKKDTSRLAIFLWGLIAIGFAAAITNHQNPISAEEKTAKQAISDKNFAMYKFASSSAKFLKSSMRDPESFVVEAMLINDEATVACVAYRSKNGFGGMNRDSAVVANEKISRTAADWNKQCKGKRLKDFTEDAVKDTS